LHCRWDSGNGYCGEMSVSAGNGLLQARWHSSTM
jgi:hypothetical protein